MPTHSTRQSKEIALSISQFIYISQMHTLPPICTSILKPPVSKKDPVECVGGEGVENTLYTADEASIRMFNLKF